jgi:hypothetical protein
MKRRKNCVDNEGDFVEKNLNFVNYVSMIYVNFIIIIIVVSETKIGGVTFVPPLILMTVETVLNKSSRK